MRRPTNSDRDRVSEVLARLPAHLVLRAHKSPTSGARVGNLVIGPCGVFAVDALRGDGVVKVRNDTLWFKGRDLSRLCLSIQRKAAEIGSSIRHAVTPVLCLPDAKMPSAVIHLRHVVVCSADVLAQYIVGGPQCLDVAAVQSLAEQVSILPPPTPAIPAAQQRRQPRRQSRSNDIDRASPRFFGSRMLATTGGTVLCVVGALAMPALAHLSERGVDQFVRATSHARSTAVSPDAAAPQIEATGQSVAEGEPPVNTEASPTEPVTEMLPRMAFQCPEQGGGWTASAIPSEFAADPVGYHLWYQTSGGVWQYWGQFKSGIEAPTALLGLSPGEAVDVRIDRTFRPNAEGAPTMLTFTAPDEPC